MPRLERPLTLKWSLLNALAIVLLVILATRFHSHVHGAALVIIPVILAIGAYGSSIGLRLSWRADATEPGTKTAARVLHEARYLEFWAWVCQMSGILATVIGFFILLSHGDDTASLGSRIQEGGGTALLGTFIGVFASLVLSMEHRLIEHDLEG